MSTDPGTDPLGTGRFQRREPAPWLRLGDEFAYILIALILAGGFFTYGYAQDGWPRGAAWAGCALLGLWSMVGLCVGRWAGDSMKVARWVMGVFAAAVLWTGLQTINLPSAVVEKVSPVWRSTQGEFTSAGMEQLKWMPLAHAPEKARRSWHQLVASGLFFSAVVLLANRRSMALRLLITVAVISGIEGWMGIFNYALAPAGRSGGAIYNPNHHAALAIMGLPLALATLYHYSRSKKRFFKGSLGSGGDPLLIVFGLLLVAFVGWLVSFSRAALIFGTLVLIGWAIVELWRSYTLEENGGGRTMQLRDAVILGAAVVPLMFFAAVAEGFTSRFLDPTMAGRVELSRATLAGLEETRFLGLGLGGAEAAINRFLTVPTRSNAVWSHNDYTQAAAELGWPGLLLVGIFVVGFFRALWMNWGQVLEAFSWDSRLLRRAAWAGILITLLHATADFHLRIPMIGFTFLALLGLALQDGLLFVMKPTSGSRKRRSERTPTPEHT